LAALAAARTAFESARANDATITSAQFASACQVLAGHIRNVRTATEAAKMKWHRDGNKMEACRQAASHYARLSTLLTAEAGMTESSTTMTELSTTRGVAAKAEATEQVEAVASTAHNQIAADHRDAVAAASSERDVSHAARGRLFFSNSASSAGGAQVMQIGHADVAKPARSRL